METPALNGAAPPAFPIIESSVVVEYLASVLEVTLGASRKDLEGRDSLLSKGRRAETVQRCTRFATEAQVALYVQKDVVLDTTGADDVSGMSLSSLDFRKLANNITRSAFI